MDVVDQIHGFMKGMMKTCFDEVAASPKLTQDFDVRIVDGVDSYDAVLDRMIGELRAGTENDHSQIYGQTLVIEERDPQKRTPHYAGRYLVSPLFRIAGGDVYVSPVVLFQMKFDGKLHKFMHRYDNAVEHHRLQDVTRPQILNHVLNSFTFYRMHAFSDKRPW
jgi:hypothetical protein